MSEVLQLSCQKSSDFKSRVASSLLFKMWTFQLSVLQQVMLTYDLRGIYLSSSKLWSTVNKAPEESFTSSFLCGNAAMIYKALHLIKFVWASSAGPNHF